MSAETWSHELEGLRGLFVREAHQRLVDVDRVLEGQRAHSADANDLAEVRRAFHSLAGSGGSYGYPEVSRLGREAESTVLRAIQGEPIDADVWRRYLDELRCQLPPAPMDDVAGPRQPVVLGVGADGESMRKLERALEGEDLQWCQAESVESALRSIEIDTPSAVVIDGALPRGDVASLLASMRSQERGSACPAMVVGFEGTLLERLELLRMGAAAAFPMDRSPDSIARELAALVAPERTTGARILAVEDDPAQAAFVETVLRSGGHHVTVCGDPAGFERALADTRPELVLMDVVLPGASGYELVTMMRQDERFATVPVVFLTAETDVDARVTAMRVGGDDHLAKPVEPGFLLSTVAARLERSRLLRGLVERDALTGLLNRHSFAERATIAMEAAARKSGTELVLAQLDVDHFKQINDTYGHTAGDTVLATLGLLLRRGLRSSDIVGRCGGEEFGVVLVDVGLAQGQRLVDRLRTDLEATIHEAPDGRRFRCTLSAGVAPWSRGVTLGAWTDEADRALYAAKRGGRNRVCGPIRLCAQRTA